ncbi:MAG: hypothetical protein M4579_001863 [Chaenotheca gracillima]|nr:MAG: hypothetical protein M4579_001863 [Chaenotheca gracillima]
MNQDSQRGFARGRQGRPGQRGGSRRGRRTYGQGSYTSMDGVKHGPPESFQQQTGHHMSPTGEALSNEDFPRLGPSGYPGPSQPRANHGPSDEGPISNLEDHLRGMILSNTTDEASNMSGEAPSTIPPLPPHMRSANAEEQRHFMDGQTRRADMAPANAALQVPASIPPRKKMNQAERRQNYNKLNVPISPNMSQVQGNHTRGPPNSFHHSGPIQQQTNAPHQWRSGYNPGMPNFGAAQQFPPASYANNAHHQRMTSFDANPRPLPSHQQLYEPPAHSTAGPGRFRNNRQSQQDMDEARRQSDYLQEIAVIEVTNAAATESELNEKESFRATLESISRQAIADYEGSLEQNKDFDPESVKLKCFGSVSSGFATKDSDMDLALFSPHSHPPPTSLDSPIARILEKAYLDRGFGARLLTRARVPIIKLCERPPKELSDLLIGERENWEKVKDVPAIPEETSTEQLGKNQGQDEEPVVDEAESGEQVVESEVEKDLARMKQRRNETIYAFYRRLRGTLFKLEGSDVNFSRRSELEESKVILLNQVTNAFVCGLFEQTLQQRLQEDLAKLHDGSPRSLSLVWMQAEGERIVLSWEERAVHENSAAQEQRGEAAVKEWRDLQEADRADLLAFSQNIKRTWDKLKTLSSAKPGILVQLRDENAEAYFFRTKIVLHEIGGRDRGDHDSDPLSERDEKALRSVIEHFVDGLSDGVTRQHMQDYLASASEMSLSQTYSQICTEARIRLYEKGQKKGIYSDDEVKTMERFVELVREQGSLSQTEEFLEARSKLDALPEPPAADSRDQHFDPLEFPKTGVGLQCDINFSNDLALHNTLLLRCYSHCDPRVRPMVLFVKAWAKRRMINSPYHGTLSSYGYVLMVLHYLVNVVTPPAAPNLQLAWKPPSPESETTVDGFDVRFWRHEQEIRSLAAKGMLTHNKESVGSLLRGFFDYYARQGPSVTAHGFSWGTEVLSIRTQGGLVSKKSKGWTGAKTTITEATQPGQHKKEVRHRYLFAIEDPFEIDHNIARTVTHNGIVAVRDEFRRAWKVIINHGKGGSMDREDLLEALDEPSKPPQWSNDAGRPNLQQ